MLAAFAVHWPEYLIEGALLATFMVSACLSVSLVQHPGSPVRRRVASPVGRRAIIGLLMGLTAIGLIYSPWGARSGAHMNPAVTLAFLTLGKVAWPDAVWYIAMQFLGGAGGIGVCRVLIPRLVTHESVGHVATRPGPRGAWVAWVAELGISGGMMTLVLVLSNLGPAAPYTGLAAGLLVAIYITVEAPLSGMSINPARSLASALFDGRLRSLWVYFTAPPAAMLLVALAYAMAVGGEHVLCAKLNHSGEHRCIFRCHVHDQDRASPARDAGIEPGTPAGDPDPAAAP